MSEERLKEANEKAKLGMQKDTRPKGDFFGPSAWRAKQSPFRPSIKNYYEVLFLDKPFNAFFWKEKSVSRDPFDLSR